MVLPGGFPDPEAAPGEEWATILGRLHRATKLQKRRNEASVLLKASIVALGRRK